MKALGPTWLQWCRVVSFSKPTFKVLAHLLRLFRCALLLFYGRFGLPLSFEVPLLYVIGKRLKLPRIGNPTQQVKEHTTPPSLA